MKLFNFNKQRAVQKNLDSIKVSAFLSDEEIILKLIKGIKENRWDQILITGRGAHRTFITDETLPVETRREGGLYNKTIYNRCKPLNRLFKELGNEYKITIGAIIESNAIDQLDDWCLDIDEDPHKKKVYIGPTDIRSSAPAVFYTIESGENYSAAIFIIGLLDFKDLLLWYEHTNDPETVDCFIENLVNIQVENALTTSELKQLQNAKSQEEKDEILATILPKVKL